MTTDDLITLDEAVDQIIATGKAKTRRAARKMLEDQIRSGKLPGFGQPVLADGSVGPIERIAPDHEPEDDVKNWLRPEETLDYGPKELLFPLSYFSGRFGLEKEEILAELRSGRLVVEGKRTLTGYKNLAISLAKVADWLANPDTPPALVAKVWTALRSKLQ
jgi:hypothetical protein